MVADDVKESHGVVSEAERKFSSTPDQERELAIGHAAANELPGSALLMGAGAAATGGVTIAGGAATGAIAGGKAYLGRFNYLSDKTADQVSAYLSHYFAAQGWISSDKARSVKLASD
ncbi:MAG TPA: hypothetical protein VMA09_04970 [Candidatus Binataceae bacterium]|nr:hypothetical protein [Candidatus Binataceae bacterium]